MVSAKKARAPRTLNDEDDDSLTVGSDKELAFEIRKIAEDLKDDADSWQRRIAAIKRLSGLVTGGAYKLKTFGPQFLSLQDLIVVQILDLRSAVVKEICEALNLIARTMGDDFEAFADFLIPQLLKITITTIKVISTNGHSTILSFIRSGRISQGIKTIILSATGPNDVLRGRCAEYLFNVLQYQTPGHLEKYIPMIEEQIKKGVSDKSEEARMHSRRCFWALHASWPELADKMLQTLDSKTQQHVLADKDLLSKESDRFQLQHQQPPSILKKTRKSFAMVLPPTLESDEEVPFTARRAQRTAPDGSSLLLRKNLDGEETVLKNEPGSALKKKTPTTKARRKSTNSGVPSIAEMLARREGISNVPDTSVKKKKESEPKSRRKSMGAMKELSVGTPSIRRAAREQGGSISLLRPPRVVQKEEPIPEPATPVVKYPKTPRTKSESRPRESASAKKRRQKRISQGFTRQTTSRKSEDGSKERIAWIIEQGRHADWNTRLKCFEDLFALFRGPSSTALQAEMMLNLERLIALFEEKLTDPHNKVCSAALTALGEFLLCKHVAPAEVKIFLERLLAPIFQLLTHTKQEIRLLTNALLDKLARTFTTDCLLAVLLKVLDRKASLRAHMGSLEFLLYLMPSSAYFSQPTHMRALLQRVHEYACDLKQPLLKKLGVDIFKTAYSQSPDVFFSELNSLGDRAIQNLQGVLSSEIADFDRNLAKKRKGQELSPLDVELNAFSEEEEEVEAEELEDVGTTEEKMVVENKAVTPNEETVEAKLASTVRRSTRKSARKHVQVEQGQDQEEPTPRKRLTAQASFSSSFSPLTTPQTLTTQTSTTQTTPTQTSPQMTRTLRKTPARGHAKSPVLATPPCSQPPSSGCRRSARLLARENSPATTAVPSTSKRSRKARSLSTNLSEFLSFPSSSSSSTSSSSSSSSSSNCPPSPSADDMIVFEFSPHTNTATLPVDIFFSPAKPLALFLSPSHPKPFVSLHLHELATSPQASKAPTLRQSSRRKKSTASVLQPSVSSSPVVIANTSPAQPQKLFSTPPSTSSTSPSKSTQPKEAPQPFTPSVPMTTRTLHSETDASEQFKENLSPLNPNSTRANNEGNNSNSKSTNKRKTPTREDSNDTLDELLLKMQTPSRSNVGKLASFCAGHPDDVARHSDAIFGALLEIIKCKATQEQTVNLVGSICQSVSQTNHPGLFDTPNACALISALLHHFTVAPQAMHASLENALDGIIAAVPVAPSSLTNMLLLAVSEDGADTEDFKKLRATLKLLVALVKVLPETPEAELTEMITRLVQCMKSSNALVRRGVVDVFVALHQALGERLQPHLDQMNVVQRRMVNMHISQNRVLQAKAS